MSVFYYILGITAALVLNYLCFWALKKLGICGRNCFLSRFMTCCQQTQEIGMESVYVHYQEQQRELENQAFQTRHRSPSLLTMRSVPESNAKNTFLYTKIVPKGSNDQDCTYHLQPEDIFEPDYHPQPEDIFEPDYHLQPEDIFEPDLSNCSDCAELRGDPRKPCPCNNKVKPNERVKAPILHRRSIRTHLSDSPFRSTKKGAEGGSSTTSMDTKCPATTPKKPSLSMLTELRQWIDQKSTKKGITTAEVRKQRIGTRYKRRCMARNRHNTNVRRTIRPRSVDGTSCLGMGGFSRNEKKPAGQKRLLMSHKQFKQAEECHTETDDRLTMKIDDLLPKRKFYRKVFAGKSMNVRGKKTEAIRSRKNEGSITKEMTEVAWDLRSDKGDTSKRHVSIKNRPRVKINPTKSEKRYKGETAVKKVGGFDSTKTRTLTVDPYVRGYFFNPGMRYMRDLLEFEAARRYTTTSDESDSDVDPRNISRSPGKFWMQYSGSGKEQQKGSEEKYNRGENEADKQSRSSSDDKIKTFTSLGPYGFYDPLTIDGNQYEAINPEAQVHMDRECPQDLSLEVGEMKLNSPYPWEMEMNGKFNSNATLFPYEPLTESDGTEYGDYMTCEGFIENQNIGNPLDEKVSMDHVYEEIIFIGMNESGQQPKTIEKSLLPDHSNKIYPNTCSEQKFKMDVNNIKPQVKCFKHNLEIVDKKWDDKNTDGTLNCCSCIHSELLRIAEEGAVNFAVDEEARRDEVVSLHSFEINEIQSNSICPSVSEIKSENSDPNENEPLYTNVVGRWDETLEGSKNKTIIARQNKTIVEYQDEIAAGSQNKVVAESHNERVGLLDETDAEGRVETDAEGRVETDGEGRVETDAEGRVETDGEGRVETDAEGRVETDAEGRVETDTEGRVETDAEGRVETDAEGRVETDAEGRVKTDAEGRVKTDTEGIAETDSERKHENEFGACVKYRESDTSAWTPLDETAPNTKIGVTEPSYVHVVPIDNYEDTDTNYEDDAGANLNDGNRLDMIDQEAARKYLFIDADDSFRMDKRDEQEK